MKKIQTFLLFLNSARIVSEIENTISKIITGNKLSWVNLS